MASKYRTKISEDLERLIKSIGDSKSKTEEDRIICKSIEATKAILKDGNIDKSKLKELLIKLIYYEMLGYDASFGHFIAVQTSGSNILQTKLVAYLATSQFLDANNNLILLLVNTWRTDLQSDNHIIICSALTTISKLVNVEAIGALAPQVVSLLSHSNEIVRKKAIMVMHKFYLISKKEVDDDNSMGANSAFFTQIDFDKLFRTALCDKDPSVMSAALNGLYEVAKSEPFAYRNLIPSILSILKQITENRLNKNYDYHHVPAPFTQIKLLKILGILGAGDKPSTENMRAILLNVLKQNGTKNTIVHAVIYECIKVITTISPDTYLLEAAAKAICTFLRHENPHNLKYMGISALAGIVKMNSRLAQDHQSAVLDCLEDPDDSLKLKTLELLYKMTKTSNVEIVCEKLIAFLSTCSDKHIQKDICRKVSELSERYAPDNQWYVQTMFNVLEVAGDVVDENTAHMLMRLIAEQEVDVHHSAIILCINIIDKPKIPELLLKVACWVLGEYGPLVCEIDSIDSSVEKVMDKIASLISFKNCTETLQSYVLNALTKLHAQTNIPVRIDVEDFLQKACTSKSIEIQQRALEFFSIIHGKKEMLAAVLPPDSSCEDMEGEMEIIKNLSFLDDYVQKALDAGADAYVPEDQRSDAQIFTEPEETTVNNISNLKYEAYEKPSLPVEVYINQTNNNTPLETNPNTNDIPANSITVSNTTTNNNIESDEFKLVSTNRRWGPVSLEPEVKTQISTPIENHDENHVHINGNAYDETERTVQLQDDVNDNDERGRLKASLFGNKKKNTRSQQQITKKTPKLEVQNKTSTKIEDSINLLDLTDDTEPQTTSQDPFSLIDNIDGLMPIENENSVSKPQEQSKKAIEIDLDSLYGNNNNNYPLQNSSGLFNGQNTLPVFNMNDASAVLPKNSIQKLGTQTKNDDPFKDLLS